MAETLTRQATERLRSLVLSGALSDYPHLTEQIACDALGMSRTPVRAALQALAQEGLLDHQPHRGYRIRPTDPETLRGAYAVRAVLEGMAVRVLAEAGLGPELEAVLADCVAEGGALLAGKPADGPFDAAAWRAMNGRFHRALAAAAGNATLQAALRLAEGVPLAAVSVIADLDPEPNRALLFQAQADHAAILAALRAGQSARAEARMREHVTVAGELLAAQLAARQAKPGGDGSGPDSRRRVERGRGGTEEAA